MSQVTAIPAMVGNDFAVMRKLPRRSVTMMAADSMTITEQLLVSKPEGATEHRPRQGRFLHGAKVFFDNHVVVSCALIVLLVGLSVGKGITSYTSFRFARNVATTATVKTYLQSIPSLNITVNRTALQSKLQTIIGQPVDLTVDGTTVPVGAATIRSWLKITPDQANTADDNIFIQTAAMASSLKQLASTYIKAPVDEVTVTHTDGVTPSGVILAGQNGTGLSNPNEISNQVPKLAPDLAQGKGLLFNAPLASVPFKTVTPAAFSKLIEVNLTTKRLYAYQNGQLVNTFLVSAGKPSTPTPVGEFHIWTKLTSQTMIGPGYVQPNVPWVNYFDHSGDAIHGVYWRPASVFGNVNTSHGCVGLEVAQAEWVYNWAPIGTTVITYA